jgi:hypothetical protein
VKLPESWAKALEARASENAAERAIDKSLFMWSSEDFCSGSQAGPGAHKRAAWVDFTRGELGIDENNVRKRLTRSDFRRYLRKTNGRDEANGTILISMSKFSRESQEKAEKLLLKSKGIISENVTQEIERRITAFAALGSELKGLKEAAKDKRLDIEENARALNRLTNKAKRAAQAAAATRKAEAKAAKRAASGAPVPKP